MLTWKIIVFFVHTKFWYLPVSLINATFYTQFGNFGLTTICFEQLIFMYSLIKTRFIYVLVIFIAATMASNDCPFSLQCSVFLWFSNSLLTFLHVVKFHLTAFEWYGLFSIFDHLPNPFEVKTKRFDSRH